MTTDKQDERNESRVLSRKGVEIYQRVTGNEGPSPLMKRYLKFREKRQAVESIRGNRSNTR
jgi:hypothetical protein